MRVRNDSTESCGGCAGTAFLNVLLAGKTSFKPWRINGVYIGKCVCEVVSESDPSAKLLVQFNPIQFTSPGSLTPHNEANVESCWNQVAFIYHFLTCLASWSTLKFAARQSGIASRKNSRLKLLQVPRRTGKRLSSSTPSGTMELLKRANQSPVHNEPKKKFGIKKQELPFEMVKFIQQKA